MRLSTFGNAVSTLITISASTALSAPTPWSESLLEDINTLRASGLSEADIALRFPRALFYPNPTSPPKITLYSPPDLRSYTRHSSSSSSAVNSLTHHHATSSSSSSSTPPSFLARLAQTLGLIPSSDDSDCTDHHPVHHAHDTDGGERNGDLLWELELMNEEANRQQGRRRLREGVGNRGGEMGRMEVEVVGGEGEGEGGA